MIRKNSLFCKLIRIKNSSESLFSSFMKDYSLTMEECPYCHSRDNCIFHGSYERNLIDFIRGKTVYHKISVTRVKCQSCGHTHAILPEVITLRIITYFPCTFLNSTFTIYIRTSLEHTKEHIGIIRSNISMNNPCTLICIQ